MKTLSQIKKKKNQSCDFVGNNATFTSSQEKRDSCFRSNQDKEKEIPSFKSNQGKEIPNQSRKEDALIMASPDQDSI
jgi:hypothetical protein